MENHRNYRNHFKNGVKPLHAATDDHQKSTFATCAEAHRGAGPSPGFSFLLGAGSTTSPGFLFIFPFYLTANHD